MGMKQRLGIALCLLSSPDCLILDEPINGLDAKGINEIRRLLVKLNEEKQITILISSHILTELQLIASRYVFIKDGEIVEDISKEELEEKSQKQILVKVQEPSIAAQVLETVYPTIQYKVLTENTLMIQSHVDQGGHINTLLIENGVHVLEFRIDTFSLEDYFLELVEGESHDELSKK
ncbi:ABC transporter ATP-binding protein [Bacillus sp. TS-2]|nr:ABC transporter ATP-binding protein [Bacillus sp. TS-2]